MQQRPPGTIVVTGGPGGGKTTALDLFQRELKSRVKIVPEAATLLFGHGLGRDVGDGRPLPLQRSIYRMQTGLEDIFRDCYPERLLICDRGTLDGLAYWPGDEADYFASLATTYEREAARYGAVIFFQSAAIHGEDVRSNNPYRSEGTPSRHTVRAMGWGPKRNPVQSSMTSCISPNRTVPPLRVVIMAPLRGSWSWGDRGRAVMALVGPGACAGRGACAPTQQPM